MSLLDIHPPPSHAPLPPESRFEILEAGTGHGGLTLYLARAVHAFNVTQNAQNATNEVEDNVPMSPAHEGKTEAIETPARLETDPELQRRQSSRRAIIHSIDISTHNSFHARKIVRGFKEGLYASHVDFHVGDVSEWISQELTARAKGSYSQDSKPFLAHVLLDLPMPESHLERLGSALKVDGVLTVFNPSITQITACVELIREKRLPFLLDQVLELGPSMTGGREWSVQAVRPRAAVRAQEARAKGGETGGQEVDSTTDASAVITRDQEHAQALESHEDDWTMICRPKVGGFVSGGGFLGVWRRMRPRAEEDRSNVPTPNPDADPGTYEKTPL